VQSLGWLAFGTAFVLVVLHRRAAKRYLDAYETAHGSREPGASWLIRRDPVPMVEDLRLRRLLLFLPASSLIVLAIVLHVFVR
jgi:hypothetical protein